MSVIAGLEVDAGATPGSWDVGYFPAVVWDVGHPVCPELVKGYRVNFVHA